MVASSPTDEQLACLIELFATAEQVYPYLTRPRLGRLLQREPDWTPLRGRLGAVLRQAARAGLVLTDQRERLDRAGLTRPVLLYRLNYRHPRVVAMVGSASE